MKPDLFIAQMLYGIMAAIAFILAYQFFISKNGILRRLMIFHFLCQCWSTGWSGLWFFMEYKGFQPTSFGVGRIISLAPLCLSLIFLLIYVVQQNNKKIKNHKL